MSDSANLREDSTVLKCKISVKRSGSGYDVTYDPERISVTDNNTDLHFHIDAKSSDAVEIDTVTINPPGQTQLINGQVNANRQQFSVKDLNTIKGTFNLKFTYKDKHGNKLSCQSAMKMAGDCDDQGVDIPEVDNNPPG